MSGAELTELRPSLLELERVDAFSELAVNRSQQFARLLRLALVTPEARHAHCGAEFPGLSLHAHMLRHACGYKLANDGHAGVVKMNPRPFPSQNGAFGALPLPRFVRGISTGLKSLSG